MQFKNKIPLFIGGATLLGVIVYAIRKASAEAKASDFDVLMDAVQFEPILQTGFAVSEKTEERYLRIVFPFYSIPIKSRVVEIKYDGNTLKYNTASGSVYNTPFTYDEIQDNFKEVQGLTGSKKFTEYEIKMLAALLEAERGSFKNKGIGYLGDIRESGAIIWAFLNRMALDPDYTIGELIYDPPAGSEWKAWNAGLKDRIVGAEPSQSAFDFVVLVLSGLIPNEIGSRTNLLHIYTQIELGRTIPNWALPKDHPRAYTLNMVPPIMINDAVFAEALPA
jgi:hypothetical protein